MNTLQKLSYGQYIATSVKDSDEMTTRDKDYIAAASINWAMQTSFSPPMMALAVDHDNDIQETIEKSREFTLHLLGEGQENLLEKFASTSEIIDKTINGVPYKRDENGQIIIDNTLGFITCSVEESINAGDHTLYLAKVINEEIHDDITPLTTEKTTLQYA